VFPGNGGEVDALAFSPDGLRLASGGRADVLLWDVAGRRVLRRLADDQAQVSALAFSPDGALIAGGREDSGAVVWEAESGEERARLVPRRRPPSGLETQEYLGPVTQLFFSADGRRLATVGMNAVFAWELPARGRPAGEPRRLDPPDRADVGRAGGHFGPGTGLTVAYGAMAVRWDAASGKELGRIGRPVDLNSVLGRWVRWSVLSSDGRLLAAGSESGALAVWEMATGEEVLRLQGEGASETGVCSLAFDASGRLLAAGRVDGVVRIWSVGSGKELARREGHKGKASALAFSPDGRLLASGGADTTVLLWDVAGLDKVDRGAGKLKPDDLEERWRLLAGADSPAAHRAAAELAADPDRATPFLAERLRAHPLSEREIDRRIADLDADAFAVRERASAELRQAGDAVEAALRREATHGPPPEARRRIGELLQALPPPKPGVLTGETVRTVRALGVLERAGTAEARRLLRELAKEGRVEQVRAEARAALERLPRNP
jgi:dipeptidyl aminopeptidase/acylaminoacyl peptidase